MPLHVSPVDGIRSRRRMLTVQIDVFFVNRIEMIIMVYSTLHFLAQRVLYKRKLMLALPRLQKIRRF